MTNSLRLPAHWKVVHRSAMFVVGLRLPFSILHSLFSLFCLSIALTQPSLAQYRVPTDFSSIQEAINFASNGDSISIAPGTYAQSLTISKKIKLIGDDTTVVVTPPAGNGITITADSVVLRNIKVAGGLATGIVASGRIGLLLENVVSRGNTGSGGQFSNTQGLSMIGGSYSNNLDEGLNIIGGYDVTLNGVTASGNGKTGDGTGVNLQGVIGTNSLSGVIARFNQRHGVSISNGSRNITVIGGNFSRNGTARGSNGGGISVNAESANVQNIVIRGNVVADSNFTAGVWVVASTTSFQASNISVGQSGSMTFRRNHASGVAIYGRVVGATITANISRGGTANAAGVVISGTSTVGANSPTGIAINNCSFTGGYDYLHPAITLSTSLVSGYKCITDVTADGNYFGDAPIVDSIAGQIFHKPDDPLLGTVILTNSTFLPVELTNFEAQVVGSAVRLNWRTATEAQNYGFDVERKSVDRRPSTVDGSWVRIGFVQGSGTSSSPREYSVVDYPQPNSSASRLPILHSPFSILSTRFSYRLKQIDFSGAFSYSNEVYVELSAESGEAAQLNAYPNPFNSESVIRYRVSGEGGVTSVRLYDISGRRVSDLWTGEAVAGLEYSLRLRSDGLASGTYFLRLETPSAILSKKLVLLK